MEELKSRLQAESSRREIFERKNAELETINDQLRTENHVSKEILSYSHHSVVATSQLDRFLSLLAGAMSWGAREV